MHVVNPLSTSLHVFFLGGERLMNDMYLVMHASEATVPSKKLMHQETVSSDRVQMITILVLSDYFLFKEQRTHLGFMNSQLVAL